MQGKAHRAGNQDSEKRTQQKAHAAQSQSPVKVRGPRSYGWRDLYNLLFLVSSNLLQTGGRQEAQLRDSGEATPQHVPKVLSAEPQ